MKNDNQLNIKITCSREEMIERLKQYKHELDYIIVCESTVFDVLLGLTWQNHSKPFIENYYQANIIDNQIMGKIVSSRLKTKPTFKGLMNILKIVLLGILSIYGIPFIIIYGLSDMLYLSLLLAFIPLIALVIVIIFLDENHIDVHNENIKKVINSIDIRSHTMIKNKGHAFLYI